MLPMKQAVEGTLKREPGIRSRRAAYASLLRPCFGLLVAGLVFVLYLRTLAPDVLYYERPDLLDAVMFQTQAYILGITHPTGYPTYLLLAHLFTYLPFGDPAYQVNLASVVFGAVAVFVVYLVGLRLSGRLSAAAVGALAFGIGNTFWSQAVLAEVYTLNAVFVSLVLLVLFMWRDTREDRLLLLAAFMMGLSLSHHATSGLLLPAAALFIFKVDRSRLSQGRLILKGAGLFLIGLVPYLYLPIRGSMLPQIREADPTSVLGFFRFVTGSEFLGSLGRGEVSDRISSLPGYFLDEFHIGLLLVAAVGALVMRRRDRAGLLLLGFLFVGWTVHAFVYNIFDYFLYFIPPYLILALLIAVGAGDILARAERLVRNSSRLLRVVAPVLFSIILIYLAVSDARSDYSLVDRSGDLEGRRIIDAVAEKAAPNAAILHHRSPLWYMVLVEERRTDLILVSPWYAIKAPLRLWSSPDNPRELEHRPQGPDADYTGVPDALELAEYGPVYFIQGSVKPEDFEEAGFTIVPVEGVLYELVPPEGTPHTLPEERQ